MFAIDRREFLGGLGGSLITGSAAWNVLQSIVPARADELQVTPQIVQFRPEMEAVVRWIEAAPREQILEQAVDRLKKGLPYRQLVGGLFLAGIRNIKPRPVGFKFHAVMVISAAHQLSLDAPQADRLLPFFWALDNFKIAQAQDVKEGDWSLVPVNESAVPPCRLYTIRSVIGAEGEPSGGEVGHSAEADPERLGAGWKFGGSVVVAAQLGQ